MDYKLVNLLHPDKGQVRRVIHGAVREALKAHAPDLPKNIAGQVAGGASKRAMNSLVKGDGPLAKYYQREAEHEKNHQNPLDQT
jgi:hypothetical protein